jgi:hypothetical protein
MPIVVTLSFLHSRRCGLVREVDVWSVCRGVRAWLAWVVAKVMLMLRCRRVQATSGRVLWTARGDDMMGWSASTPQQMSSVGGV